MVLSFVVAAIFGVILGAPTLRLRGDYLAIVTLAFGEIVPRAFLNLEQWTNGSKGINPIGRPIIPWFENGQLDLQGAVQLGPGALVLPDLRRRLHLGVRDLPTGQLAHRPRLDGHARGRARGVGMGIDLVQTKLLAFALGASFSGFAGSLWASMLQLIDPFQFDFSISIMVLAMIILGGIGNIWGVIFGGVVLGFYDRVLTSEATNWLHGLAGAANIPVISPLLAAVDLSQYKFAIFGAGAGAC